MTVQAAPGDAIVIDYRLLHGTHANATDGRRDCLILTFAPRWSELPEDVKAHLIRHPCLPSRTDDLRSFGRRDLLPVYRGMVRDLPLTRSAPTDFSILEPK